MKTRTGSRTTAGTLLKDILKEHPAFSANPLGDWGELVGEQVARYCLPKSLKDKKLTILAHDSVWKHHLEECRQNLVELINRGHPEPVVDEIVIRVGELPAAMPNLNPRSRELAGLKAKRAPARKKAKNPARKLTPEEEKLIKGLPDPELRSIGRKLLKRTAPE